jgi:periplasmic divalent cation tolerance protein
MASQDPGIRLLYVTTAKLDEAWRIGQALVTERLAACANVLPGMQSCYWWEGKLEQANECVLILKTRQALVDRAVARIKTLHSYAVPCVVALPVVGGNPDFLAWIGAETGG